MTYKVNRPKTPITLVIEQGQVVDCENSTPEFGLNRTHSFSLGDEVVYKDGMWIV